MSDLVVDLCAGAGGWDVALDSLGYRSVGIETDHAACVTARAAGHQRIQADITAYPPDRFAGAVGLVASPPCTDFSKAGRRKGLSGTTGQLVWEPVRWVESIRPEWCCFEQVPEVLPIWRLEADRLRALGYSAWCGILDAANFGVPQNRLRAILVASRVRALQPPQPTHCQDGRAATVGLFGEEPALEAWVSMAEALGWESGGQSRLRTGANSMVTGRAGSRAGDGDVQPYERHTERAAPTIDTKAGHAWRLHTNRGQDADGNRQVVDAEDPAPSVTAKSAGQWKLASGQKRLDRDVTQPSPTVALGHDSASWCWTRPATTIVGSFGGQKHVAAPGHHGTSTYSEAKGAVPATIPELGVLQGFPADYPWQGTKTAQGCQVGNAIPPPLAAAAIRAAAGPALPEEAP